MYRQERSRIKMMCDDVNCHGECGLFHTIQRRAKSVDVRSSRSSSSLHRSTKQKESEQVPPKVKRKKQTTKKTKPKQPLSGTSSLADRAKDDEWARLDEELHDQRHYFAPTTSVTNSLTSLNSSATNKRKRATNTVNTVHSHDEIPDFDGAEKGKDNEWELLKAELIVKQDMEKARLFAAEELERQRREAESPEAETTLDDIIEAARRKSIGYKAGSAHMSASKRRARNSLHEPSRVRCTSSGDLFEEALVKVFQEDGGSSVQAVLTDSHFATQLLDSDEEGGIVGDPPSTIDSDLDLEHLVYETRPPLDAFSNPTSKTADPLAKQLSRSRTKKKTLSDDEMSVDFSVVDLSVTSRLSIESGYDDIEMLSSAVQALANRSPDAEYVGSLLD